MKNLSHKFNRDKSLRKRLKQMEERKADRRKKKIKLDNTAEGNPIEDSSEHPVTSHSDNEFSSLSLSQPIMDGLNELAFVKMTPVQRACLPLLVIDKKDALVSARTGSGKTLAYVIPMMQRLREFKPKLYSGTCAIILVPTRELAVQVYGVVRSFAERTTFRTLCMTGGKKRAEEINEILRGSCIIVATPGRLLAYLQRRCTKKTNNLKKAEECKQLLDVEWERDQSIKKKAQEAQLAFEKGEIAEEDLALAKRAVLDMPPYKIWFPVHNLKVLIVDEVDRMLEQGFAATLKKISDQLPNKEKRQTMLFSATVNPDAEEMTKGFMKHDHVRIAVGNEGNDDKLNGNNTMAKPLEIEAVFVLDNPANKLLYILNLIGQVFGVGKKIMVFVSCIAEVEYLTKILSLLDIHSQNVFCMHSQMPEQERRLSFLRFCRVKTGLLICTDVAARGLDVPDVDWVIQFDPPRNVNEYLHRVGRTGRAGATGNALLLLRPNETLFLQDLVAHIGTITHWTEFPLVEGVTLEILQKLIQSVDTLYNLAINAYFGMLKSYLAYPRKYYNHLDLNAMAQSLGLKKQPKISGVNLRKQVERIAAEENLNGD